MGKLLRLDINSTGPYNIPPNNPFIGVDGADEVWAYGLRNAWKFNFDTSSGNVMIADVGQGQIEEINRQPISQVGLNYGWRCYEGNTPYNTTGCPITSTMTFPVTAYNHTGEMFNYRRIYLQRHTISGIAGKIYFCRLLFYSDRNFKSGRFNYLDGSIFRK